MSRLVARLSILAGCLAASLLVSGCAGANISSQQSKLQGEGIAKPGRVLVYDFAGSIAALPPNSPIVQAAAARMAPQAQVTPAQDRRLGTKVAKYLIDDLNLMGIPAIAAGPGSVPRTGDVVIHGAFAVVDEGDRLQRVLIGFGAGASELKTVSGMFLAVSGNLIPLTSTEIESKGSKMPGMAVSLGFATASSLAISGVSSVYSEVGPESLNGAAERTARKIAAHVLGEYARRGWR
jgi:hypothetical protein